MRLVLLLFFLLNSANSFGLGQEAKAPKQLWIVAPGLFDYSKTEKQGHLDMLQLYLEKAVGQPVKIELKTAPGFMIEQYRNLQAEVQQNAPDWIFYIQRSSFYAYDLRDLWLSKTPQDGLLVLEKYSDAEILAALPDWLQAIADWPIVSDLKKAVFIKQRVLEAHKKHPYFQELDNYLIFSSQYISERLHESMSGKTKLVFLISPERIKFADLIFAEASFSSYIARSYFLDNVIERPRLKEETGKRSFQYRLLPKEFAELSQPENLVEKSPYTLNSNGVLRSFQILTPVLSEYLRAESKR